MFRIFTHLIPQKRKEHGTEIMRKHQKLVENIIREENHIFGNVEQNDTNNASNNIKKYIKKVTKIINTWHHKTTSQNDIKKNTNMLTNWSQNDHKMSQKSPKNGIVRTCQKMMSGRFSPFLPESRN